MSNICKEQFISDDVSLRYVGDVIGTDMIQYKAYMSNGDEMDMLYNSKTGKWSTMAGGIEYGSGELVELYNSINPMNRIESSCNGFDSMISASEKKAQAKRLLQIAKEICHNEE